MAGKHGRWRTALVLVLGLLAPGAASAGPYFGDWDWAWHQAQNCPRGQYSPLHYWTPQAYWVRAMVHPSNLDRYAPGPSPPVQPIIILQKYPCRSLPPIPSAPYADPAGYYGRAIAPD